MKFISAIWELFVSILVGIFTPDEETENEQWLRERLKYANQAKTNRYNR